MIIDTMIVFGTLALGTLLDRPTKDVYEYTQVVEVVAEDAATTKVVWPTFIKPAQPAPSSTDGQALITAFSAVGVSRAEGVALLERAKGILKGMSGVSPTIVPVVASDPEEGASYLVVRMRLPIDMASAVDLDFRLTRELIKEVSRLPERLSFEVCEAGTFSA